MKLHLRFLIGSVALISLASQVFSGKHQNSCAADKQELEKVKNRQVKNRQVKNRPLKKRSYQKPSSLPLQEFCFLSESEFKNSEPGISWASFRSPVSPGIWSGGEVFYKTSPSNLGSFPQPIKQENFYSGEIQEAYGSGAVL
ncbi:MAG: hypothetical protein ACRCYZ_04325 [Alphaproteobacteria bacterium]